MSVDADQYDARLALASKELDRLVRRLQTLSGGAWSTRREPVVALLARLVDLTGLAEHRDVPPLPALENYALADATAVLAGDVMAALSQTPDDALAVTFCAEISAALQRTR